MSKNTNTIVRLDQHVTITKANAADVVRTVNSVSGYSDALRANYYAYLVDVDETTARKRFIREVKRSVPQADGSIDLRDYSGSAVTRFARMAIAYRADVATPYGSDAKRKAWTLLGRNANAKAVAAYLKGDTLTTAGLVKAIRDLSTVKADEATSTTSEGEGEGKGADVGPSAKPMTFDRADDLLTSILDASGSWSVEDRDRLVNRLHAAADYVADRTADAAADAA